MYCISTLYKTLSYSRDLHHQAPWSPSTPAPLKGSPFLLFGQRHDGELNLGDGGEAVEGIGADGVPGVEIAEDGDGRAVRELREDLRVRLRVRAQAQIAVRARGLGLKFVAGRAEFLV